MKLKDWVAGLKHLAMERVTYYDNSFPSNCGEINPDGSISFDCIGLVKSVINEPDICYKTSPAWYYVTPGQVIPDTTEIGILNLCSNVHWGDFSNCITGAYVYMEGHAGVFVSDFIDTRYNNTVNTIECTPAMDGGVTTSYTDIYGNRFNHKGGNVLGRWEAWGILPYIDYSKEPEPEPVPTGTVFTYQVWDDINRGWLPNVQNDSDYAGIFGSDVDNVFIDCNIGDVEYCVHTWAGDEYEHYPNGGQWLPWVKNREDFAGDNIPIDGIAIRSAWPCLYQAHLRKTGGWLETVYSKNCNLEDPEYGFAGIIGQPIDAIIIRPF